MLLLSCTGTEHENVDERHYLIYRNQGYLTKMVFHDETNPYIAKIVKDRKQFILIVTDTILNQKYILKSDEPIIITGGDIKYKNYGRETFD